MFSHTRGGLFAPFLCAGLLLVLVALPASSAPWWWAQFTLGDGVNSGNSQYERWSAFAIAQANDATDTTYLCSYTWGSADIGTINGISAGNSAGLNSVSAAGGRPTYLIGDGDGGAGLTNAKALADANVTEITEPAGSPIMHIKDIYVANRGYLIASTNHTAGGWNSQNGNGIWFRASALPLMMRKVEYKMNEMVAGRFHNSAAYGTKTFYSTYGDTVELWYSPEDNDGSTAAGTGSLLGRLRQLAQGARQSIFYMSDAWSSGAGQTLLAGDITGNNVITICGVGGAGTDWDAATQASLEANHTHRNDAGNFNHLHSKCFIFDMEIVATGSANMTGAATYTAGSNDEAYVIVHDFRLARRYMTHYKKCMSDATNDPSADAFDVTAPAGATALTITPTDTAFYAGWTASATADVTRYYLFIDTAALTQKAVGNRVDDDADGYIDEDPRGDYDGFASGATAGAGAKAADDDADGVLDEDPWMPPEVMVRGKTSTTGAIRTWNVGDSLQAGVNYYFGVVSVDTQGNEGVIATAGPFQLGSVVDTRLIVQMNAPVADTTVRRGDTGIVAAQVYVRGETGALQDTLTVFAVKNLGRADSADVKVWLWRDEDSNARLTSADTLLAQLVYSNTTQRFQAAFPSSDSRVRLGATGKAFLVMIDIYDTAGLGDTFQAQVDARTCSSPRRDSGPSAAITSSGRITITFRDTAPPTAPVLSAPADLVETRSTSVTLRWSNAIEDSSPPVRYRVQVDTSGAFTSNLIDTTGLLETFIVVTLRANETSSWRVIASDSVGNTVVSTTTRRILVDTVPPAAGSLTLPAAQLDTTQTSFTFLWSAATDSGSGVSGYRLQVDTSNTFLAPFIDSTTPLTSATRTLPANDTYYWRVVAVDDAGNTQAVTARRLRIDTAGPSLGSLSSPAVNFDTRSTIIRFSWAAASDSLSGTISYRLQVDTTSAFTAPFIDSATPATSGTRSLIANDTYYWRVLATDSLGNTSTHAFRRLRIDTTTPTPAVLITKHGDSFSSIVPLTWVAANDSICGIAFYVVQVDTAGTFVALKDSATHWAGDTAHNFSLPISDTYYWRVLAYDSAGNVSTSVPLIDSFRAQISDTTPPLSFNLTAPADLVETRATSVTLRWQNAIDDTSPPVRYRLQVDLGGTFAAPYYDTTGLLETFSVAPFLANCTSTWRVIAFDNSGNTVAVNAARRIVVDTDGPVAGALTAPTNLADTRAATVTFRWTACSDTGAGVFGYRLQVDTSPAFASPGVDSSTPLTSGSRTLRANDTYYWRVVCVDDVGNTTAIASNLLRVDTAAPTPGALSLPPNGTDTTATTLSFSWSAASDTGTGLASYRFQVDTTNTFVAPFVDSSTTLLTASRTLAANDTYYWRVLAVDNAGNTVAYSAFRVRVDTAAPSAASLSSPADIHDTQNTNVTFTWSAPADVGSGVASYRLQVDTDAAFPAPFLDSATPSLFGTLTLPANDTYYWRVIAIDNAGNTTTGPSRRLRCDTAAPAQVVLTRYRGDSVTTPVLYDWAASFDTVTAIRSYVVQADTAGTFLSLAESMTTTPTITDFVSTLSRVDTYFWRVLAIDSAGNTSTSSVDSFVLQRGDTVPPTAFTLTSPAHGTLTSATSITFAWSNAFDDSSPPVSYNLQADTSGAFTSLVVDVPWQTDTFATVTVPANDTYFWRAIARDNSQNTTASSSIFRFSVDTAPPSAPALVLQRGAAIFSPVTLAWSAASDSIGGVDTYVIQLDTNAAFPTPYVRASTTAPDTDYVTAWLPPDTYFWRVYAVDRNGESTVSNPSFDSFVVRSLDTAGPLILGTVTTPSTVSNAVTTVVSVTVMTTDSAYVDTVLVNLAPIGGNESAPATPRTAVPSSDSVWTISLAFDTRVAGGTYDLVVSALDAALNRSTTTIRVTVTDASSSLASLIDTPLANIRVSGNEISVVSTYGDSYARVLYEYRSVLPLSGWMPCTAASGLPNPDVTAPFWGFFWNISELVNGRQYDVRAVGTDRSGVTDPSPSHLRVTVDAVDSNVNEYRDPVTSEHTRRQRLSPDTPALSLMADGTRLFLPAAAVPETFWVRITSHANAPSTAPVSSGLAVVGAGTFRELVCENGRRTFPSALTLTLPYGDSDALNDKVGTTVYNEADLAIYHFDDILRLWIREATSAVDPVTNTVTATVDHFTQFAVFGPGPAAPTLSGVVIYPNPFVPNDANERNGVPFVSGVTGGIFFDSLPVQVRIDIFDIAGRRVATLSKIADAGRYQWDARDDDHRELASSMYLVLIRSASGEQTARKILIIR